MRCFMLLLALGLSGLTGCAVDTGLQNIAQECRSEDANALASEYPDAALVEQHDQLEHEAAILNDRATADYKSGNSDAGDTDIRQAVQASEDADGLYNYRQLQQSAEQCWQMLDELAGEEQAQWAQFQQQNAENAAAAQAQAAAQSQPNPSPALEQPSEDPTPYSSWPPQQPPQTYMDTPYAPIVPPALRTAPIGKGGSAVPPVAQ